MNLAATRDIFLKPVTVTQGKSRKVTYTAKGYESINDATVET